MSYKQDLCSSAWNLTRMSWLVRHIRATNLYILHKKRVYSLAAKNSRKLMNTVIRIGSLIRKCNEMSLEICLRYLVLTGYRVPN